MTVHDDFSVIIDGSRLVTKMKENLVNIEPKVLVSKMHSVVKLFFSRTRKCRRFHAKERLHAGCQQYVQA
jgi:hypothetical protein